MIAILVLVVILSLFAKDTLTDKQDGRTPGDTPSLLSAGTRELPTLSGLVKTVSPIVVNINTTTVVKESDLPLRNPLGDSLGDDFFGKFFGNGRNREFRQRSLGSGFIIDKEGYILTNNHVVEKASSISVKLSNDREYTARVIGRDAKTDIALIKINAKNSLPVAKMGDSDNLEVGDWVMAMGNPFGLDHTVTVGIVSAKSRIIGQGPYDDFIQTDASINPGNSGGPLFNLKGEVVGINTAIVSGGQGIGFAIPVNVAKSLLAQLKSKGKAVRGWLGVVIQRVTPELAKNFGLKEPEGALVSNVVDDGPAARAGIRRGDVIVAFDGKTIKEMEQLPRIVAATEIGRRVKVRLIRERELTEVTVTVVEAKESIPAAGAAGPEMEKDYGLVVQNITPEIAHHMNIGDTKGVIVTDVRHGSVADDADMRAGDIITEADRKKIRNVDDFRDALTRAQRNQGVVLFVKRDNVSFYAVLKMEKGGE
jgi:serine protease Do